MISKRNRASAAAAAAAALVFLAGCGSSDGDDSPEAADTSIEQTTTIGADGTEGSPTTPPDVDTSTTTSESAESAPEIFGDTIPVPEGSTFKDDGFAIGSDGPRKAEFELSGDKAGVLDDYKATLETAGFTISREQAGRAYVATKGDLELQLSSKNDLYDDAVVVLTIIYTDEAA